MDVGKIMLQLIKIFKFYTHNIVSENRIVLFLN